MWKAVNVIDKAVGAIKTVNVNKTADLNNTADKNNAAYATKTVSADEKRLM